MTNRLPPVPPAGRSKQGGPGHKKDLPVDSSLKHPRPANLDEQGETANIKQNTTNKGFYQGRRVK